MFVSVLSAAATWSLISSQLVPVLGFFAWFSLRDLREFNLTGLNEHGRRDAHTDRTYTATTEFEYTRRRNVSRWVLKRSNFRVLTLRGDDVYGTVNQRVGLQDSLRTYEYELPRVIQCDVR